MNINWKVIGLGKHKDKTLPEAFYADPDWFYWVMLKPDFNWHDDELAEQSRILYMRSRNLKLPASGKLTEAEYTFEKQSKRFISLAIVAMDKVGQQTNCLVIRKSVIDLGLAKEMCPDDKTGSARLLSCVGQIIFGMNTIRLTRAMAAAWFNDDRNFCLVGFAPSIQNPSWEERHADPIPLDIELAATNP